MCACECLWVSVGVCVLLLYVIEDSVPPQSIALDLKLVFDFLILMALNFEIVVSVASLSESLGRLDSQTEKSLQFFQSQT